MAEYYQNFVTEKSFQLLKQLNKDYQFILIGGWAIFFYTRSLKSKDIDIIIDFSELEKLRRAYEVVKNDRLKKYEISRAEVDIDIYLPFYSQFCLPVKAIQEHLNSLEGFKVPQAEVLLILKQQAYQERRGSTKGEKDKLDILALLNKTEINFAFYQNLLHNYQLVNFKKDLISLLKETQAASQLDLNVYKFSQLKKRALKRLEN